MDCGEFLNPSSQLQEESIERLKIVNSMKEKIQQDGSFIFLFVYNKLVLSAHFYLFSFQFSVCSCELGFFGQFRSKLTLGLHWSLVTSSH